jgi:hypothetical protein
MTALGQSQTTTALKLMTACKIKAEFCLIVTSLATIAGNYGSIPELPFVNREDHLKKIPIICASLNRDVFI